MLVAIASTVLLSCTAQPPHPAPATAPASRVTDLEGRPSNPLAPTPSRRATVLLFITHDCPISNGYAPEVRRLAEAYQPQGIAFYLVYADPTVTPGEARQHHHDYAYPCPALLDPDHELAKLAGATVTPEAAVYLPGGQRVYRGRINDLYVDLGKPRFTPTTSDLKDVLEAVAANRPLTPKTTPAIGCHIPM
jgi:hypothetical protein